MYTKTLLPWMSASICCVTSTALEAYLGAKSSALSASLKPVLLRGLGEKPAE